MKWRDSVADADRDAVLRLVRSTGFFSPGEEAIAVELVDEAITLGTEASGYEFVFAAFNRDYTMILGTTCMLAALIVVFNLLSDFLAAWMNPRLRQQFAARRQRRKDPAP